jgi:CheY-like chemotaxis protein
MKNILVIDDDKAICTMITDTLEEEGYSVSTARDGQMGLALLEQSATDLIICDVLMSVMDGIDFCQAIQATPAYRAIPLILISGRDEAQVRDYCTYTAYLKKPFAIERLVNLVNQHTRATAEAQG